MPAPTITVLSTSPALASILGATLRRGRNWRVREFRDSRSLSAYMRIAPVAILVSDYTLESGTAADIAIALRSDALVISRHVQIIALSKDVDLAMRQRCVQSGIDEVIVKPMSPLYLEERIKARLKSVPRDHISCGPVYAGPERRERIVMDDTRPIPVERRIDGANVVSFLAHKARRDNEERV
ncbi:response regulator [Pelagibacterium limicola]|uniref:response regulator n=1 Tax=Pelagibacterium limicola TaxID=2791022 RepID=UPI0018AFFCE7|nr:response regulator [Pelagibacterium limicola]